MNKPKMTVEDVFSILEGNRFFMPRKQREEIAINQLYELLVSEAEPNPTTPAGEKEFVSLEAKLKKLMQEARVEAYDLLYWKYKEMNGQTVDMKFVEADMKFVEAYNALVSELQSPKEDK